MNGDGKSDSPIEPKTTANKDRDNNRSAESDEGRGLTKGNSDKHDRSRTQKREALQHALDRIREAAERDSKQQFTALWHHVANVDRLREAFYNTRRDAAAGTDGVTWEQYAEGLEEHLEDLSGRLHRGAYRAKPVLRRYIPKPDGRQRPLGIPVLEDKVVQKATAEVLNAIYETDFMGFSYGFRPGRSQHNALDAIHVGIEKHKVNWVLDADIRGFFDAIDHEWLIKLVEHRIGDKRVIRHIRKWLNAGVLENGKWEQQEEGTPQGGSISPLLANIYLHYVFDLWAHQWRNRNANGDVIIVRYADDFVVGFQHRHEAEKFLRELTERLAKFNLELHPDKTRLIEFGRFADSNRQKRGEGKPETFDFLGFTHFCGKTRAGYFKVGRKTVKKRQGAKLKQLRAELRRRMHWPTWEVGMWLGRVLRGYYQYYAVPGNIMALGQFRTALTRIWKETLSRRSQKGRVNWKQMTELSNAWLPRPRILHPYPDERLVVSTQGRSPVR
jgi:group II intron reverse transcriptase/maturase